MTQQHDGRDSQEDQADGRQKKGGISGESAQRPGLRPRLLERRRPHLALRRLVSRPLHQGVAAAKAQLATATEIMENPRQSLFLKTKRVITNYTSIDPKERVACSKHQEPQLVPGRAWKPCSILGSS